MSELMKAVVYEKKGGSGALVLRDIERPVPGDDAVLIEIRATAVNAADYRSIKMGIIPKRRIFGADIAGRVVSVGKNCRRFAIGDEVLGDISEYGLGGFAEYVAVPEAPLVLKPSGLTFENAAALPMSAVTALQALQSLRDAKPNQRVLIIGAGGGVGTFAVQLAKHFRAEVTAVCGATNVPLMQSLHADHIINYQEQNPARLDLRYDLILAIHGNNSLADFKRLLTPDGVCVVVGGAISQVIKTLLFGRFYSIGRQKIRDLKAKPDANDLEFIVKLVEAGEIRPIIDQVLPLDDTAAAVEYASGGHARGKVIVTVPGTSPTKNSRRN